MTLPEHLRIRPAERSDDEAMRALLAECFPSNAKARADIASWQWWDNPFGESIAFVCTDASDGDRVVGQMLAVCLPATFGGEPATLAIGVDLATAPAHRGAGIARRLIHATHGEAIARGRPVYLFPNEASMAPLREHGWEPVCQLDVRVLPTDPDAILERLPDQLSAIGGLAGPVASVVQRALGARVRAPMDRIVEVDPCPPGDVNDLWHAVADRHPYGVARHGQWWRWRYGQRPGDDYRIVTARVRGELRGVAAVSTRDDLGGRFRCILDLLATDVDDARAIVGAVVEGAADRPETAGEPVAGVAAMAAPGSRLAHLLGSAGLVRIPTRALPRPAVFGLVPAPTTLPDPHGLPWATAWGDIDHV